MTGTRSSRRHAVGKFVAQAISAATAVTMLAGGSTAVLAQSGDDSADGSDTEAAVDCDAGRKLMLAEYWAFMRANPQCSIENDAFFLGSLATKLGGEVQRCRGNSGYGSGRGCSPN